MITTHNSFTMNKCSAEIIEKTWNEFLDKEELSDDVWDIYAVSSETQIVPGVILAYYYPCDNDDGWMQIEFENGNKTVEIPVRHIEIEDNYLTIYYGVQYISFRLMDFDDDGLFDMSNAAIIDTFDYIADSNFLNPEEEDEENDTPDDSSECYEEYDIENTPNRLEGYQ